MCRPRWSCPWPAGTGRPGCARRSSPPSGLRMVQSSYRSPSAPASSTSNSEISWFSRANTSLAAEPSGPGRPAASCWRSLVPAILATSASAHSRSMPVVQAGRAQLRLVPPGPRDRGDHAALARHRVAADRDPLVHQRRHRHGPALADVADPVGVRDPGVGDEHLVELGVAGDLPQRPDLDAGLLHVEREVGQPLVLRARPDWSARPAAPGWRCGRPRSTPSARSPSRRRRRVPPASRARRGQTRRPAR